MPGGGPVAPTRHRTQPRQRLGEQLLAAHVITAEQLRGALDVHAQSGVRVGQALASLGYVEEEALAAALAQQAGVPYVDLRTATPDTAAARLLPKELERERGILPLHTRGRAVVVACTDLPDEAEMRAVERALGRPLQTVMVTESAFDDALNQV